MRYIAVIILVLGQISIIWGQDLKAENFEILDSYFFVDHRNDENKVVAFILKVRDPKRNFFSEGLQIHWGPETKGRSTDCYSFLLVNDSLKVIDNQNKAWSSVGDVYTGVAFFESHGSRIIQNARLKYLHGGVISENYGLLFEKQSPFNELDPIEGLEFVESDGYYSDIINDDYKLHSLYNDNGKQIGVAIINRVNGAIHIDTVNVDRIYQMASNEDEIFLFNHWRLYRMPKDSIKRYEGYKTSHQSFGSLRDAFFVKQDLYGYSEKGIFKIIGKDSLMLKEFKHDNSSDYRNYARYYCKKSSQIRMIIKDSVYVVKDDQVNFEEIVRNDGNYKLDKFTVSFDESIVYIKGFNHKLLKYAESQISEEEKMKGVKVFHISEGPNNSILFVGNNEEEGIAGIFYPKTGKHHLLNVDNINANPYIMYHSLEYDNKVDRLYLYSNIGIYSFTLENWMKKIGSE